MKQYEKEILQADLDREKEVLKRVEEIYKDALDEINDKIAILLGRADADQQHVVYQVQFQKSLKLQIQAILETLQANEFETVSEYLTKSYEEGFLGTMYSLHKQEIPLIFPIDQSQIVAAVQNDTKLKEDLYTSLGKDITILKKKITGEVSRGLATGMLYGEIARNVASWAGIPKNNAMRITRTEAHRIQVKASMDACEKAKSKGADVVKVWDATRDSRTRDSHRKVDGEIRELDERFSNGLRYPGDPNGAAGEVINCRCALLQRARWALGNDYTKWSADAPIITDKDGTTQFAIIDSNSFKEFKGFYMDATRQMTMNFENDNSQRVRSSAQKIKNGGEFRCFGDYLRDVLGSAKDNNKEELAEIVDDVTKKGGKFILLKNNGKMVTNVSKGVPAIIEIDENASIGAVRHEYRHFLDDYAKGCPGLAYYLQDTDGFFEYEKRAYEEELEIARKMGYNDIEKKILREIEGRRKEIYGK